MLVNSYRCQCYRVLVADSSNCDRIFNLFTRRDCDVQDVVCLLFLFRSEWPKDLFLPQYTPHFQDGGEVPMPPSVTPGGLIGNGDHRSLDEVRNPSLTIY